MLTISHDYKDDSGNLKEEIKSLFSELDMSHENFLSIIQEQSAHQDIKETFHQFKSKKHLIQVGLGGSALGPQMLFEAFKYETDKTVSFFNNSDPYIIKKQLEKIDLEESLFYVVSKSGTTAETMGILSAIFLWLQDKGVKKERYKEFLIFCTDPVAGDLKKISNDFQIKCLEVPPGVGGRFSVLTAVGLFAAQFIGLDIDKIRESAHNKSQELLSCSQFKALINYIVSLQEKNIRQTVLMPYSSRLKFLSDWFVQLWAESLGKEFDRNNKQVHQGLTPISSYGASDQHSQMQLFIEGPKDKFIIFIKVNNFEQRLDMRNDISYKSMEKLSKHTMNDLINCQLKGTIKVMDERKRPYTLLTINKVDASHLGELIIFFELLTTLVGNRLNINPFNQPGVEAAKRYTFEFLNEI